MKLIPDLFIPSCFTLLTAPVASGKTRMVVEFYREYDFKIIYLSPLRALANEVDFNLEKNKNKKDSSDNKKKSKVDKKKTNKDNNELILETPNQ